MRIYNLPPVKRCNLAFGGMQGFYYASTCMFFGFLMSYLSSQGYSYIQLGLVSTLIAASTMLAQPLSGYIMDSFVTPKRMIVISALISTPFSILFFVLDLNKNVSMILIALVAIFFSPLGGVIDSWSVRLRGQGIEVNYPVTRSMGSIFYSFSALIMGYFISQIGYSVILPMHLFFLACALVCSRFAEDVPCKNKSYSTQEQTRISLPRAVQILIGNKAYTVFLISYFFFNLGMKVVGTFITTIMEERGGNPTQLGLAFFIAAFFELPILLVFSRYIIRLKLPTIYIISLFFGFFRIITINFSQSIGAVMLAQLFQGFSFGFGIPFLIEYVTRVVPEKLKATALTIGLAVGSGAALIIGNSLGGVIMDRFGTTVFIYAMTGCMIVSMIVFVVPLLVYKVKGKNLIEDFSE